MPDGNVTACQKACQAESGCAEFQYHFYTRQCSLARDTNSNCNVLVSKTPSWPLFFTGFQAGPDTPLIDSCLPAGKGCPSFREEDCSYDGPVNTKVKWYFIIFLLQSIHPSLTIWRTLRHVSWIWMSLDQTLEVEWPLCSMWSQRDHVRCWLLKEGPVRLFQDQSCQIMILASQYSCVWFSMVE